MLPDRNLFDLSHRLDTRLNTDIRDLPVPGVTAKRMRPPVFATKIFDGIKVPGSETTNPHTVSRENDRGDPERQQCGLPGVWLCDDASSVLAANWPVNYQIGQCSSPL